MKKVLVIMLLALVCASMLFADAYKDANKIVKQGLKDSNIQKIKELSLQLTADQKQSLYTWNKVSTVGPFLSNLFLGFGSGSTRQGDTLHGLIFLAGDVVFTGLIIYDVVKHGIDEFNHAVFHGDAAGEMTAAMVGLIGIAGLRIYQAIRPFVYAKNYNGKLRDALNLDSASVAFLPVRTKDGVGYSLSARIPFN